MCATLDLTFGDALPSTAQVIFLRNISDDEKLALLRSSNSLALLYTPPNEHFGIVPLEAMACSLPVLACNHGGPKESIEHEVSGFLLPSEDVSAWVEAMAAVTRPGAKDKMGSAGAEQVVQRFSRKSMATTLDREVREVFSMARPWAEKETQDGLLRMAFALFMIFMLTLVFSIDAFTENKCVNLPTDLPSSCLFPDLGISRADLRASSGSACGNGDCNNQKDTKWQNNVVVFLSDSCTCLRPTGL